MCQRHETVVHWSIHCKIKSLFSNPRRVGPPPGSKHKHAATEWQQKATHLARGVIHKGTQFQPGHKTILGFKAKEHMQEHAGRVLQASPSATVQRERAENAAETDSKWPVAKAVVAGVPEGPSPSNHQ